MNDADILRSNVIAHMMANFNLYEHIDRSSATADLPPSKCYASIVDRIVEMSNPNEMIGEIEIMATSRTIQPFFIYTENNVLKFGNDLPGDVLRVLYCSSVSDVGHYSK